MAAVVPIPVTSIAPAAEIARSEGRRAVGMNEDQLIVGYLGRTSNVHDKIIIEMEAHGITWTMMAAELGCSRQALVASLKRRHVQFPRLLSVCKILKGVPRRKLTDEELAELSRQVSEEYIDNPYGLLANCRLI